MENQQGLALIFIILGVILTEAIFQPRLEWTRKKHLLLFFNDKGAPNRVHIRIW